MIERRPENAENGNPMVEPILLTLGDLFIATMNEILARKAANMVSPVERASIQSFGERLNAIEREVVLLKKTLMHM
jgi:hypothetical protein